MLQLLTVRNLALVDSVQLELGPGLTILTGETGAGKSVLMSALSLVLGGRASSESVRAGAGEAEVEALFEVRPGGLLDERLEAVGIEHDGELVVRRVVQGNRSRAFVNGRLATVGMLQDILRGAVEVTSQHENVALLEPDRHVTLLDRWAGTVGLRQRVAVHHGEVQGYRRLLASLDEDDAARAQREDFLRYALEELRALDPQPGETDALQRERERLRRSEELRTGLAEAELALCGGDADEASALGLFGRAQARLERLAEIGEPFSEVAETAARLGAELDELVRGVQALARRVDEDPGRLDEVEERLDALRRLQRKYGGSEEAVEAARRRMEEELDHIEHEDVRRADLQSALEAERRALQEHAARLTEARTQAAPRLAAAIREHLGALHMADCQLEFSVAPLPEPGPRGAESVELTFAAHATEPLRPLRKIASGGELSRLLLALKRVETEDEGVVLQAFDEVDAGLGGDAAEALGAMLQAVSQRGQVLCITHLPQVAARADAHCKVEKATRGGRVVTDVRQLDASARVEELARMLGAKVTPKSRSLAKELLERASVAAPRRTGGRRRPSVRSAADRTSSPR
jgi:DNA repair protein RecN (Recombination protein N)